MKIKTKKWNMLIIGRAKYTRIQQRQRKTKKKDLPVIFVKYWRIFVVQCVTYNQIIAILVTHTDITRARGMYCGIASTN